MARRRVPTRAESLAGILPVLANATAHRDAADVLAASGYYGFAMAHLVLLALEESEKARTLAKVAIGEALSEDAIRRGLYEHKDRHVGAMAKSWSSGGAIIDLAAESLRERLRLRPARTDAQRLADIDARHPEVLPKDWPETAGSIRERNLYVDLGGTGWSEPAATRATEYERLRPAVNTLLAYLRAAYEREIRPLVGATPEQR
jgi:AbiV family abortive infection protein